MSKVLLNKTTLQQTADAIRNKSGTSQLMTPAEMAAQINNISGQSNPPARPEGVYAEVGLKSPLWVVTDLTCTDCDIVNINNHFVENWASQWTYGMKSPVTITITRDSSSWSGWGGQITDGTTTNPITLMEGLSDIGLTVGEYQETASIVITAASSGVAETGSGTTYYIKSEAELRKMVETYTPFEVFDSYGNSQGTFARKHLVYVNFGDLAEGVLTSLPQQFMVGATSLVAMWNIPESVTTVGHRAFAGTGICSDISLPGVTSIGNYFMQGCLSFNGHLSLPKVVTIGSNFLTNCINYNQDLDFPELETIGANFLQGDHYYKNSFNSKISAPKLRTCGTGPLAYQPYNQPADWLFKDGTTIGSIGYWYEFNQPVDISGVALSSQNMGLFSNCPKMESTVYVGDKVPFGSSDSFAVNVYTYAGAATCPAYVNGIKIAGASRAAWLSNFPAKDGPTDYRKLVDAGS